MSSIIALLEVSFLLILSLINEMSPHIKITSDTFIQESVIMASTNGVVHQYYDNKQKKWVDIAKYQGRTIGGSPCEESICKDIPNPIKGEKVVYYTGKLQEELSFLISDSCLAFPNKGANVKYHIKENGTVDRERLLKEYPFFKYIIKYIDA